MRGKRAGRGVTAGTTSVAATADAAGTASFLNTPPRSSCSRQIRGSVEEVDQESKWVTARTECSDVLLPPDPLKPGEGVHSPSTVASTRISQLALTLDTPPLSCSYAGEHRYGHSARSGV